MEICPVSCFSCHWNKEGSVTTETLLMLNIKYGWRLLVYWWWWWNLIFAVSAFISHTHLISLPTHKPALRHLTESWQILAFPHVIINSSTPSLNGQLAYYLKYLLLLVVLSLLFGTDAFTNTHHVENRKALKQLLASSLDYVYCYVDNLTLDIFIQLNNSETPNLLSVICLICVS